jgi:hypothetical protein
MVNIIVGEHGKEDFIEKVLDKHLELKDGNTITKLVLYKTERSNGLKLYKIGIDKYTELMYDERYDWKISILRNPHSDYVTIESMDKDYDCLAITIGKELELLLLPTVEVFDIGSIR